MIQLFFLQNMTRGLMGNWTFDIQDDFTLPDGSEKTVYQTSDLKNLHDEFAMECKFLILYADLSYQIKSLDSLKASFTIFN